MMAKFGISQIRQVLHGHAEDVMDNVTHNVGMLEEI
jgi:hypothetical protein